MERAHRSRGATCVQYRVPARHRIPRHAHATATLILGLGGSFVTDTPHATLAVQAGDAVLLPAGGEYGALAGPGGTRTILIRLESALGARLSAPGSSPRAISGRPFADLIAREVAAEDDRAGLAIEALIHEWIGALAPRLGDSARPDRRLERAREFLEAHLAGPIGLSEIAHEAGISRSQLARAFRGAYGCSIGGWLRARRLEVGACRLSDSDASVSDVAQACGFYDHAHFTSAFRRRFGVSPSAYRRLHQHQPRPGPPEENRTREL